MNANRIEKAVITVICVLAALLVLLAIVHSTQPTRTAEASGAAFSRIEHSDLWVQPADPYSPLYEYWGHFQGTGECGYYGNVGTEHRNGKVNPGYCNSQGTAETSAQARPVSNKHTVNGGGQTIDDGGVQLPPVVTDKPAHKHCDKGSGNGAEGCDPGKHPEKGNNDEGGDHKPTNCNGGGEHGNKKGGNKS
jgi:hypothetical protein